MRGILVFIKFFNIPIYLLFYVYFKYSVGGGSFTDVLLTLKIYSGDIEKF